MMMPQTRGYFDILDNFFDEPFFRERKGEKFNDFMKTDIKEEDGNYIMDIDIPGVDKDNIKIELNNGYITVSTETEKNVDESDKKKGYIHKERFVGSCQRSYYAGNNLREEDIKASFKNGTLTLSFPKDNANKINNKKYIAIE